MTDLRNQFLTKNDSSGNSAIERIDNGIKKFYEASRPRSSSLTSTKSQIPKPQKQHPTSWTNSSDSINQRTGWCKSTSSPLKKPPIGLLTTKQTVRNNQPLPSTEKIQDVGISSNCYKMDHPKRGKVAIFLHEEFTDGQPNREGAEVDKKCLLQYLPRLGFQDIKVYKDFTYTEINQTLDNLSKEDFVDQDCLMIFVLTHGYNNDTIHAKDTDYLVEKIWKPFMGDRCPGLAGKPKIFFIVACRGDQTDPGVRVIQSRRPSTKTDAAMIEKFQNYTIPTHADTLTIYSTMPGYFSYRESNRGTWYIEALCQELRNIPTNTKINFTEFLTAVNKKLAFGYTTYNTEDIRQHQMKQCASYTSTLTKSIYFMVK